MSTARLDKGDHPHCGELGPTFSLCVCVYVCVCVCVHTCFLPECTHALAVCLLPLCVCVYQTRSCLCTFLCRIEGLSGFSKWNFQRGRREILLSRLHPLTSKAASQDLDGWLTCHTSGFLLTHCPYRGILDTKIKVKGLSE